LEGSSKRPKSSLYAYRRGCLKGGEVLFGDGEGGRKKTLGSVSTGRKGEDERA